jgi:parallel beta-helix repeat protein
MRRLIVLGLWLMAGVAAAAEVRVTDGESIQAAIGKASPGDVILVEPGTYKESLHIDKQDITLRGVIKDGKWPRLDGERRLNDGVIATGSNFLIENFHVANYKGNGVMTQAANNIIMRHLIVEDTGIYGIYPTLGTNVIIEDTITSGIEDAGIYVGMCQNVEVRRNVTFKNVAGIEIENSLDVLVEGNIVYDNTGGILVFALPGLPKKSAKNIIVRRNTVYDNNHENFGAPGSVVANVPPGSGILILAADQVTLEDNLIYDNQLGGIIVADLGVMPNTAADPEVDPSPDDIIIMRNLFRNNGATDWKFLYTWYHFILRNALHGGTPDGTAEDLIPKGADVVSTGKGLRNCLLQPEVPTQIDTKHFGVCDGAQTSSGVTAMAGTPVAAASGMKTGDEIWAGVCSGCHAYAFRLIGPPVKEIQEKYKGNPDGIVAYALAPKKIRDNFPPMPTQGHLGKERLTTVATWMLEMTK